jgi:prepilin-type N-terminal cleavage/methylation domain-containing protein
MTVGQEQRGEHRGITLPELLVVVTIIGLAVTVSIPLVSGAIRSAELRSAAAQFLVSLQAARMIAVSKQGPLDVRISAHPVNRYEYEDSAGRTRLSTIPSSVCIVSATSPTITFEANGSVGAAAVTTFVNKQQDGAGTGCELGGGAEGFEIRTNLLGEPTVTRLTVE